MINVVDLKKSYGERVLFDEVNFTIGKNERLGIIGRNGTGKSTLLKILMGQISPDTGRIEIPEGVTVRSLEQNLKFESKTSLEEVEKGLSLLDKGKTWYAHSVLNGLGFSDELVNMDPNLLSGGYKVRLRLAQVLVSRADVLILDEPTNYLDIVSLRWLETFLKSWEGACVLVTHDRNFMNSVVTHTLCIRRAQVKKQEGGPTALLEQILKDEEVYEKTRLNMVKKREKTEDFIRKFRAGARSAGLVQSRIKSLAKQDLGEKLMKIADISLDFAEKKIGGNFLFNLEKGSFGYDQDNLLFEELSLNILYGDKLAIVGPNGKGKSTLLNVLAGYECLNSGEINKTVGVEIGYFGSKSFLDLDENKTIVQELMSVGDMDEQRVRNLCGSLLFSGDLMNKKIGVLSGGEKSRVCLGKVILKPCNLLFLDEPTNHLDMESCMILTQAVLDFPGAVVLVTHDESMLSEFAEKLVVFGAANSDGSKTLNYEYGYDKFLEEIGWGEEQKNSSIDEKKEDKRKAYQEEKYKKKEQERLFREIDVLEEKVKKEEEALLKSCELGDIADIEKLSKLVSVLKDDLQKLYTDLENVIE